MVAIMSGSYLQRLLLWRLPSGTRPHFVPEASGAHRVEVTCPGPHKSQVSSVTILPWPPSQGKSQSLDKYPEGRPQPSPYLYFIFHPTSPPTLFSWATMASLLFLENAPVPGPLNWLFPQPGTTPFCQNLLYSFLHFLESLLKCHLGGEAFPDNPAYPSHHPGTLYPPPLFPFSASDVLFLLIFMDMCKVTLVVC